MCIYRQAFRYVLVLWEPRCQLSMGGDGIRVFLLCKIDNVVFSHAGLTESFVLRHFGGGQADLDSIICRNKGLLDALEKKNMEEALIIN